MGLVNNNIKGNVNGSYETLFTKGINGDTGKSAYDIAIEDGYQGTEEEFTKRMIQLKAAYSHINGENYDFENGQPVYIHDDDIFYAGRSITDMFKELDRRINNSVSHMVSGSEFNNIINSSMLNLVLAESSPDASIATQDISIEQDKSIITWYDSTTSTQYIYSTKNVIMLNPDCSNMFCDCRSVTSLDLTIFNASNVTDMTCMFEDCRKITSINMGNWNTSNVTTMNKMFIECRKLTDIVFFSTTKNVTNMHSMFEDCRSLKNISLPNFDTSKVTNMGNMFTDCESAVSFDLSNFDTSNVTNMNNMFSGCEELLSLDLSSWNTGSLTSTAGMFGYCYMLKSVDVSNWDVRKVTDVSYMFGNCNALTDIDISEWNPVSLVTMSSMFDSNYALESLDISGWNAPELTSMDYLFDGCNNLKSVNFDNFNTENVRYMYSVFSGCSSLTELNLSSFNTKNVAYIDSMFYGCTNLSTITYGNNFIISDELRLNCIVTNRANSSYQMFYECTADKPNWTNGTWDANGTFLAGDIASLTTGDKINIAINDSATRFIKSSTPPAASVVSTDISSGNNGSIVTWYNSTNTTQYWYSDKSSVYMNNNSSNMFNNKRNLQSIDISDLNTAVVEKMEYMFGNCASLVSLDISNFDMQKVTSVQFMFEGCTNLKTLIMPVINAPYLTKMTNMFRLCKTLTSIDFSGANIPRLNNTSSMFDGCISLVSLDFSSFDMSNNTNMSEMFNKCRGLKNIIYGDKFIIDPSNISLRYADHNNMTYRMFNECNRTLLKPPTTEPGEWNFAGTYVLDSVGFGPGLPLATTVSDWTANKWTDVYLDSYKTTITGTYNTVKSMYTSTFFTGVYRYWTYDSNGYGNFIKISDDVYSSTPSILALRASDFNSSQYTYSFPSGYNTKFEESSHPIFARKNIKTNVVDYGIIGDYRAVYFNSHFNNVQVKPSGIFANPSSVEWYAYIDTTGLWVYNPSVSIYARKMNPIMSNFKTKSVEEVSSSWFSDAEVYKFFNHYTQTFVCIYHKNNTNGKPYECFSTMDGYNWEKIIDLSTPPEIICWSSEGSNMWIYTVNNQLFDCNGYMYDSIDVTDAINIFQTPGTTGIAISYKNGLLKRWPEPCGFYNYSFITGSGKGGDTYNIGRTVFGAYYAYSISKTCFVSSELKDTDTGHLEDSYTNMGLYSVMEGDSLN